MNTIPVHPPSTRARKPAVRAPGRTPNHPKPPRPTTSDVLQAAAPSSVLRAAAAWTTLAEHPVHRGIVAVAVESIRNLDGAVVRSAGLLREAHGLLAAALIMAGVPRRHRDEIRIHQDALVVAVHPADEVPKTLLIGALVPALNHLVSLRNAAARDDVLRLRVVVHSGEIHHDAHGFFGESLDMAIRLLDAPRIRDFAHAIDEPVVLVVSEDIYWSIVRHGYDGIDRRSFVPLVRIQSGRRRHGFVQVGRHRTPEPTGSLAGH